MRARSSRWVRGRRTRPERGDARRGPGAAGCRPGLAERVTFVHGEAERLPFSDAEFDALTFTYLLRYVDDRPRRCASWRASSSQGAGSGWSSSAFPGGAAARLVARTHARRAPAARAPRVLRVVRGGPVPRAEHRGALLARAPPAGAVARGGDPGCGRAAPQLRCWTGDVGSRGVAFTLPELNRPAARPRAEGRLARPFPRGSSPPP